MNKLGQPPDVTVLTVPTETDVNVNTDSLEKGVENVPVVSKVMNARNVRNITTGMIVVILFL